MGTRAPGSALHQHQRSIELRTASAYTRVHHRRVRSWLRDRVVKRTQPELPTLAPLLRLPADDAREELQY
jgi:hypothetical protein